MTCSPQGSTLDVTEARLSGGQPMFVVRSLAIIEDRVQRFQVARVGIQPCVDVLRLDRNDAAIVASSRDLRRRLIGDRRKRKQVRLAAASPLRPQAGHQHVLSGSGPELEDDVFFLLAGNQVATLGLVLAHVLEERVGDDQPMRDTELLAPESF